MIQLVRNGFANDMKRVNKICKEIKRDGGKLLELNTLSVTDFQKNKTIIQYVIVFEIG